MKPDSSGKKRLMRGRATSSVTRPPPPSRRTPPSTIGPLVVALDVLQPRLVEQRSERPVDHPRVPVADVRVGPDDEVAGRLVERLPERLALARGTSRSGSGRRGAGRPGRPRPRRSRGSGRSTRSRSTRTSSSSGTRPTISRIARRTIGPIVSSSLSVGSTRLTVRPCFSLSWTSRRRSANSAWWKFDSPNQRSTRAGTARDSSAARSAAASGSARAASCSNVWRADRSRAS